MRRRRRRFTHGQLSSTAPPFLRNPRSWSLLPWRQPGMRRRGWTASLPGPLSFTRPFSSRSFCRLWRWTTRKSRFSNCLSFVTAPFSTPWFARTLRSPSQLSRSCATSLHLRSKPTV
ncbi:hypothetical protein BC829DRAFT_398292 [Chytridium lagenaria]|nr:hypothetical protein BC829DRAFT_398292 [Chytridium lagenaria]